VVLLRALVPAEAIVWYGVDFSTRRALTVADPSELQSPEITALVLNLEDNPIRRALVSGEPVASQPVRMSDLVSARDFHRTRTWTDLFRPLGVDHQLTTSTGGDLHPFGVGWALNRSGRDFTDDDVALLGKLQPILNGLERPPSWRIGTAAAESPVALTPRELQVLTLVADGLTAQAIGHRLRISIRTVRKHLEHIYAKTGQRDRLLAVRFAQNAGLLERSTQTWATQRRAAGTPTTPKQPHVLRR
jgi:DNA-binding CsgD family transcriptional regulator